MLDMIECIWNKRIKVTLNFEFDEENVYEIQRNAYCC